MSNIGGNWVMDIWELSVVFITIAYDPTITSK